MHGFGWLSAFFDSPAGWFHGTTYISVSVCKPVIGHGSELCHEVIIKIHVAAEQLTMLLIVLETCRLD